MSDLQSEPVVGVVMGSASDLPTMQPAADVLAEFGVPHEVRVVSAHRSPERMFDYARTARDRGLRVPVEAEIRDALRRRFPAIRPKPKVSSARLRSVTSMRASGKDFLSRIAE